jgi:hypothetical protein
LLFDGWYSFRQALEILEKEGLHKTMIGFAYALRSKFRFSTRFHADKHQRIYARLEANLKFDSATGGKYKKRILLDAEAIAVQIPELRQHILNRYKTDAFVPSLTIGCVPDVDRILGTELRTDGPLKDLAQRVEFANAFFHGALPGFNLRDYVKTSIALTPFYDTRVTGEAEQLEFVDRVLWNSPLAAKYVLPQADKKRAVDYFVDLAELARFRKEFWDLLRKDHAEKTRTLVDPTDIQVVDKEEYASMNHIIRGMLGIRDSRKDSNVNRFNSLALGSNGTQVYLTKMYDSRRCYATYYLRKTDVDAFRRELIKVEKLRLSA